MSSVSFHPYAWVESDRALSDEAGMLKSMVGGPEHSAILGGPIWELDNVAVEASCPDWNGDGAEAVSEVAVAAAREFLDAFTLGNWPAPEVSASRRGEVVIEWATSPRNIFTLAFGEDGRKYFAALFGMNRRSGSEDLLERTIQVATESLARLYPRHAARAR